MPLDNTPESAHRYDVLRWLLTGILSLLLIVGIFQIVLEIQIQQQNTRVDEINQAAANAQRAAENTDRVLNDVLKQVNSPAAQEDSRKTRQRIINMEERLCGGPCPDSERKAP